MQRGQRWPLDLTRRLPAEILALVFNCWKDSCGSSRYGIHADWVRSTWICKRWRDVALESPGLWSSIVISPGVTEDPALQTQLRRARGAALDLLVSGPSMSSDAFEEALRPILAKNSPIRKFKIVCDICHPAIKEFIFGAAADIVSLSVHAQEGLAGQRNRWTFGSDAFPRLRRLSLHTIRPTPGSSLLNLTRLELSNALHSDTVPQGVGVHRFLAACPNLEELRIKDCFEYDLDYSIDRDGEGLLPVVTLPKLRVLSMRELALDIATAVGTLRLPALTTFHIAAYTSWAIGGSEFLVIPRNITKTLPPIRRSHYLSLVTGSAAATNHVSLSGGTYSTLAEDGCEDSDGIGDEWSVAFPELSDILEDQEDPDVYSVQLITGLFLARIPYLVEPSNLVSLELHVSDGLPIKRDWASFLNAMPGLRNLGMGCGALIRLVLAEFEGNAGLCPELSSLELCVGMRSGAGEGDGELAEFILRSLGTWGRGRDSEMWLESLTVIVRMPTDADDADDSSSEDSASEDSDSESSSDSDWAADSDGEPGPGAAGSGRDTEPTESWAGRLLKDLQVTLKDFVHEVFLELSDCPACGVEYEPIKWDAIAHGELYDGDHYC